MNGTQLSSADEWKANWTLVMAAAMGFSFMSVMTTAMGAFIGPLVKEFHWSRTLVSLGLPLAGVVTILLSPVVGIVIDRHGARRIALPGLIALMGAVCAFGLVNGSTTQWIALWLVYAFAAVAVTTSVWTSAVASAFDTGRGFALGLTLAGTAAAQAISPVLATWLIDQFGWRMAFPIMALGWGGLAWILCFLFFRAPGDRVPKAASVDVPSLPGLTLREAWRDPGLLRIGISTFALMVLTIGLLIHQIPILIEAGVSAERAALLAGAGGLAGILGKLVTGALIDRYRANWVGGITLGFNALAFALLIDGVRSPTLIVIAMLINGYSAGTKLQICTYLTSKYAGLRHFGTIFGIMGSFISLGSSLGPLLAGMIYDATGDYTIFLIAGAVGCVICGLIILTLPRYPDWNKANGPAEDAAPMPA